MRKIPKDIYGMCVGVAKSYCAMLKRKTDREADILHGTVSSDGQPHGSGVGNPTAQKAEALLAVQTRNEEKIAAVRRAMARMSDDTEREFIKRNLFRHVQMQHIALPMSERTMKRTRQKFIIYLAEELGEIEKLALFPQKTC